MQRFLKCLNTLIEPSTYLLTFSLMRSLLSAKNVYNFHKLHFVNHRC